MSVFFGHRSADRPGSSEKRSLMPTLPLWNRSSYADVDPTVGEASLQAVAVWAAVDLICSLTSELPLDVYRGEGAERRQIPTPRHLEDPGGDGQGVQDWIAQLLLSWLLRGNAVGRVLARSAAGVPTAIELRHPDRVSVAEGADRGTFVFHDEIGAIPDRQLFFKRVYPVPGCLLGLSPIQYHATTIGLRIAVNRFGRQWFVDGAHPGGLLTNSEVEDLTPQQAQTAKQRFLAALRGTREPVVMGRGWKYETIQIAPEESQFLETSGMSSAECARIFGPGIAEVLGYESGGSLTYSNVESRSTHLLVYALNKWVRRVERVLTEMLPRPQYVRLNRDALLQATTLDRFRAHEIALRNRIRTVNEVRDLEDMPPVDWGDDPLPIPGAAFDPAFPGIDPATGQPLTGDGEDEEEEGQA